MEQGKFLIAFKDMITRKIGLRRVLADSPLDVLHKAMDTKITLKHERIVGVNVCDSAWQITKRLTLEEVAL